MFATRKKTSYSKTLATTVRKKQVAPHQKEATYSYPPTKEVKPYLYVLQGKRSKSKGKNRSVDESEIKSKVNNKTEAEHPRYNFLTDRKIEYLLILKEPEPVDKRPLS